MQCTQLPIAVIVVHLGIACMAINMTRGRFSAVPDHANKVLHYIYTNILPLHQLSGWNWTVL
jgi:hypothetical protein